MKNHLSTFKNFFDLKKIYTLIFITLALWSIFAYNTITNLIQSQKIYAEIINLSGKQRMLSQKTTLIGKRYIEEKNPDLKSHLKELIDLMEKDHNYIIKNLTSEKIKNIYFNQPYNLDYEVKNYIMMLKSFYDSMNLNILEEIEKTSFELLPKLNHAVNIFEIESDMKTQELLIREQFILMGTLLTLFLEALFIVIPSIKLAKRKEEELNQLNKELEERIKLAVEENNKKEKVIQKQLYTNQTAELINNIAHQWRQPLSIISTIASGMKIQKQIGSLEDSEIENNLESIIKKTQYLSTTIDQLDNFISKEDNIIDINIIRATKNVLKMLDCILEYNKINIQTTFPPKELFVRGNITDFTTIFSHILNNSQEALINRDIKIKQIFIDISSEGNYAVISIEDNAGGIEESLLPKIFDMYFTTKHKGQGTGLGLYLTKTIVEKRFKGKISANTTKIGTRFVIKLPIIQTSNN